MPNWCTNHLHATGAPERVEEFRVLHGQHINFTPYASAGEKWRVPEKYPEQFPSHAYVTDRHPNNLSFRAACPIPLNADANDQKNAWGTKWDIESEFHSSDTILDRTPQTLPFGQRLSRAHSVVFDTAWSPPDTWFMEMAPRFPDLCITLGYEEGGNGEYGYCSSDPDGVGNDTFDRAGRGLSGARRVARAHIPKKAKPGKLVTAIYADDVTTVLKHLSQCDEDGLVEGIWPPLMYAAKAGSTRVFDALLANGHNVTWKAESGVGIVDVLMDVYPHNPVPLVEARYAMLAKVFDKNHSLASSPLASGITPAEMATRFAMAPILETIHAHEALDAQGFMGGWLNVAADTATPRIIDRLGEHVPLEKQQQFYSAVVLRAAKESNVELLRAVFERFREFDPNVHAQLRGEETLSGQNNKARDEFVQAYNALLATQAIDRIMAASKAMSRAVPNQKSLMSPT